MTLGVDPGLKDPSYNLADGPNQWQLRVQLATCIPIIDVLRHFASVVNCHPADTLY